MEVTTIGLDIAKNVFQVHGVDAEGADVLRRKIRRGEVLPFFSRLAPCVVGIEACATSHRWARELTELGHTVRLIPPSYVKTYVRRGKNDAADAAAIAEAVLRPSMRFVPMKSTDQQAAWICFWRCSVVQAQVFRPVRFQSVPPRSITQPSQVSGSCPTRD